MAFPPHPPASPSSQPRPENADSISFRNSIYNSRAVEKQAEKWKVCRKVLKQSLLLLFWEQLSCFCWALQRSHNPSVKSQEIKQLLLTLQLLLAVESGSNLRVSVWLTLVWGCWECVLNLTCNYWLNIPWWKQYSLQRMSFFFSMMLDIALKLFDIWLLSLSNLHPFTWLLIFCILLLLKNFFFPPHEYSRPLTSLPPQLLCAVSTTT